MSIDSDASMMEDDAYDKMREERVCHCELSTARDGHIHEASGYILCLHYEGEDGRDCPQADQS